MKPSSAILTDRKVAENPGGVSRRKLIVKQLADSDFILLARHTFLHSSTYGFRCFTSAFRALKSRDSTELTESPVIADISA
jgi:hypothetical protein